MTEPEEEASFANDARRLFTRNQSYQFRLMARHRDIVEQIVADSTDDDPPTRAKVLRAIREHRAQVEETPAATPKALTELRAAGKLRRINPADLERHTYDSLVALTELQAEINRITHTLTQHQRDDA